jgi:hypothetical protein
MNSTPKLLAALMATVGLAACDRPAVVNNPPPGPAVAVPTPVPGPPGPAGSQGAQGEPGTSGVVVVPAPAPAASEPPKQ